MKIVIADALHFNTFKKAWSARVTLLDEEHVCIGCIVEGKTKKEATDKATDAAFDIGYEHKVQPENVHLWR